MRIRLIRKTDFEHELYYSIRLNNAFLEKKGVIVSNKGDTEDIEVTEKESKIEKTVKKEKSNKKKSLNLDVFYCEVKGIYDLYEEELKGYLVDTFLDTGKITGFKPFDYDNAIKRKKFILDFDRVNNLNNILAQMFDIKKEQIKDRRDRTFIERMTEKVIKGVARRPFADRAKVVSSYYHLKIANSIPLLVSLVFSDLLSDKKINNFKLDKKQEKNFSDLEKRVQVYFEEEVVDFFDVDIKEAKYYEFDYSDNSSIIKKLKKYLKIIVLEDKKYKIFFVMLNVDKSIDDQDCIKELVSFINYVSSDGKKDFKYYNTVGEYENMIEESIESLTSEDSDIYYNFLHFCSLTSETFLENFSEYVKPKNKKSEFVFIPLGKENHRKSREFVSLSVAFKK